MEETFHIGIIIMGIDKKLDFGKEREPPNEGESEKVLKKVNIITGFSETAQQGTQALERYPYLKGQVLVENTGITVKTSRGDLKFAFSHTEGGQTFEDANKSYGEKQLNNLLKLLGTVPVEGEQSFEDVNKPYSKEQFEALIEAFGDTPAPYLDILGMKNIHTSKNKEVHNYNFYWSSSTYSKELIMYAWGLKLTQDKVTIDYDVKDNDFSAIVASN